MLPLRNQHRHPILDRAADRYRRCGLWAYHFARGKLRQDPLHASLLRDGLIPDGAHVVDLGCGQGLVFALLLAARDALKGDGWPADWAAPPRWERLTGIDASAARLARARRALGPAATLLRADLNEGPARALGSLQRADVILLFDVLHYLKDSAQEALLDACARLLAPGGHLLVRTPDAREHWRFVCTAWPEYLRAWARADFTPSLHFRTAGQWGRLLGACGFRVSAREMSAGTPFLNVLFDAQLGNPRRPPDPLAIQSGNEIGV
jgi:SAM-dependent methyltransferase